MRLSTGVEVTSVQLALVKFLYLCSINFLSMKGISYITDSKNRKTALVIDLKTFKKHEEEIEDLLDVLIAESRVNEESVPFVKVVKTLKRKGKL